jgi:peptidoglycan biosynthesis protein MviN/MurJ (putative lipid II flippase)
MAALVNASVLLWALRERLGGLEGRRTLTAIWKISLASVVMAVAAYYAEHFLRIPVGGNAVMAQVFRVFGAISIGLATLGLMAHLLRIEEFQQLTRRHSASA